MPKKDKIKITDVRKISQAFFIALTLGITYLYFSSGIAICWLDPFWHLQNIFSSKSITTPLSLTEHYTGDIVIPSIAILGFFSLLALLFGRFFCGLQRETVPSR